LQLEAGGVPQLQAIMQADVQQQSTA
jgi:hypothetical protein